VVGGGFGGAETQESQIGPVFKEWEGQKPNKMLLGHQDWLGELFSVPMMQKYRESRDRC
jgi:hypothetical protein